MGISVEALPRETQCFWTSPRCSSFRAALRACSGSSCFSPGSRTVISAPLAWWGAGYMLGGVGRGAMDRGSGAVVAAAFPGIFQRALVRRLRHHLERRAPVLCAQGATDRACCRRDRMDRGLPVPVLRAVRCRPHRSQLADRLHLYFRHGPRDLDRSAQDSRSRSRWAAICIPAPAWHRLRAADPAGRDARGRGDLAVQRLDRRLHARDAALRRRHRLYRADDGEGTRRESSTRPRP